MSQFIDLDFKPSEQSLKEFQKFISKLENVDFKVDADFSGAENESKKFAKEANKVIEKEVGDAFEEVSNQSKGIFENLTSNLKGGFDSIIAGFAGGAGFGLVTQGFEFIAGSIGEAYNNANEFNNALLDIQAKTGATAQEMVGLEEAAKSAFLGGVGESLAEATKTIGQAQTLLGDKFTGEELGDFTAKAQALGNLFDKDVNEVIAKATPFIKQFGLSSDEAFNLLAKGLREGQTPSDDLLDTFAEYSQLASKAGFSAGQFTEILTNGAQEGIFNLDKLADSIKEAEIRLKAGDYTTAFEDIKKGATGVELELIKGIEAVADAGSNGELTIKETLQKSTKLIDDAFKGGQISESLASQLQVAIAGTPAEDIGTELFGKIFSAPLDEAAIQASAARIGNEVSNAVGQYNPFDQFVRQAQLFTTIIGKELISTVSSLVGFFTQNFDKIAIVVGAGAAALLVFNAATIASSVATGIATVATAAWNAVLALNPAVQIALGVAALTAGVIALADWLHVSTEEQLENNQAQIEQIENQKEINRAQKETEQSNLQLIKRYEELGNKQDRTKEEQKEFADAQLKLAETYPGVIDGTAKFSENLERLQNQADKTRNKVKGLDDQYNELSETQKKLQKESIKLEIQIAEEEAFDVFGTFGSSSGRLKRLFNKSKNEILKEWKDAGLEELDLRIRSDAFTELRNIGADSDEVKAFQSGIQKIVELQRQRIIANGGVIETEKEIIDTIKDTTTEDKKDDGTKKAKVKTIEELIKELAELRIKTDDLTNANDKQRKTYDQILKQAQGLVKNNKDLEQSTEKVKAELNLLTAEADKFLDFIKQSQDRVVDIEFNLEIDKLKRDVAEVGNLINQDLDIGGLDFTEAIKKANQYYKDLQILRQRQLDANIQQIEKEFEIEDKIRSKNFVKEITQLQKKFEEQKKLAIEQGRDTVDIEKQFTEESRAVSSKFQKESENATTDFNNKIVELEKKKNEDVIKDEEDRNNKLKELEDKRRENIISSINSIGGSFAEFASNLTEQLFKLGDLIDAKADNWEDYGEIVGNVIGEGAKLAEENSALQKSLAVTEVVINTAVAISKALSQLGAFAIPASVAIGAIGAAQIATILGAEDGVIGLNSSYNKKPGKTDKYPFLLAKGESVVNAQSTAKNRPYLEFINNGGNLSDVFGVMTNKIDGTNERLERLEKALGKSVLTRQTFNLVVENRNKSKISGAVRV